MLFSLLRLPWTLPFPHPHPRPNTLPGHLSPHLSSLGWYSSHEKSGEIAFSTPLLSWLSFMAMTKLCLLSNRILRKCWAPKRHYVSQQSEMIHIKYSKYCLFWEILKLLKRYLGTRVGLISGSRLLIQPYKHASVSKTYPYVSSLVRHTFEFPLPLNISVQQSSLMTPHGGWHSGWHGGWHRGGQDGRQEKIGFGHGGQQGGRQAGRHGGWSQM